MKKFDNISLDELINQIVSSVDPSWSILKQLRYVYIELGLYLEKNTDFFMTVMNKINKENQLSNDEVKKIYNDNLDDGARKDWNKIICRSGAIILSKCLDKLNIENKIINTTNAELFGEDLDRVEIRHVFVNAKLNDHESIFLTIAADLPFIQNNLETQMFGNLIGYKKHDKDGNDIFLYEGEEVKDAISISKDELLKIDAELGYAISVNENDDIKYVYGDYFFDLLRKQLTKNNLYYDLLIPETDIYKKIINEYTLSSKIDEIDKLKSIIFNTCSYLSNYIEFNYDFSSIQNFNYTNWLNEVMKYAEELDKNSFNSSYLNLIKITDSFINVIGDIASNILTYNDSDREKLRDRFNRKLKVLSKEFINPEYLPSYNEEGFINQNYIAKKFETLFKYILGCNEERRDFNHLAYNEQIAIIRIIIPLIFNDIKDKDCYTKKRSKCMSCIYNIIRTYTLRMINDGSYEIIFEIDNSDDPIYYSYNLTSNKFKRITQTRFYFNAVNNIICSKDLKDKLKIEDINSNEKRRL